MQFLLQDVPLRMRNKNINQLNGASLVPGFGGNGVF